MGIEGKDFLWGVATSGYQSEGGYNMPGSPHNNWGEAEHSGRVAVTGQAVDFWNRYNEDFQRCRQMGLNAFRLSIEWTRVQPTFEMGAAAAPAFDTKALDAYAARIAAARDHGLEPVVTLHHFSQPAWLGTDPWLEDEAPGLFESFVKTAVRHVNRALRDVHHQPPLKWYVTINEPNMLVLNTYLNRHFPGGKHWGIPTGIRAYNRLLTAHLLAYNAIHDIHEEEGWATPSVTMNTFCSDIYWSENVLLDMMVLREFGVSRHNLAEFLASRAKRFAHTLLEARLPYRNDIYTCLGRIVRSLSNHFAPRAATGEGFAYYLDALDRSKRPVCMDYIGLDYYDPFVSHLFRPPSFADVEFPKPGLHARIMDGMASKWWDWHVLPEGLHFFCKYYSEALGGRAVLVAENGMALRRKSDNSANSRRRDRVTRSEFLTAHIGQMRRLRRDGVPMLGYLHWSLTDNYEWGSYSPRFGLFAIDYANNAERLVEDHHGDRPSETYAKLVHEGIQHY